MAGVNWGGGGGSGTPFSFGNLNPVQQSLYENQQDVPYQKFMDYFGGGNSNFQNTIMGRWLNSQQSGMNNRFLQQQSADPTGGLTWTKYLEQQAPDMANQFAMLPSYMRGSNAAGMRVRRELW